jgi:hypothetical protein
MSETKNKSAVYLGRLSAKSRREEMGEEEFKKSMKALRKMGTQKTILQEPPQDIVDKP